MRYAIYRLTAPILDRIPDISHQPTGRQVSIGLASSLLFHLLLLLLALFFGWILPQHSILDFAKPKPKLQEIELTIIPPVEEVVTLPVEVEKKRANTIISDGLAASAVAPNKPVFESDINMKAASEKPPTGDAPLPTQDGRTDRQGVAFADPKSDAGAAKPPPAPPMPETVPKQAPEPEDSKAKRIDAAKTPPPPLPSAAKPDEIAIAKTESAPPPAAPVLKLRANPQLAMLPAATPEPRPARTTDGFAEKTRVDGSISNVGPQAVDAVATPLGVYNKKIYNLVGSRFRNYMRLNGGKSAYPPGFVNISFTVDAAGRISEIETGRGTSSASFAFMCEKVVRDTKLPPPPKGLFDGEPGGKLERIYTFNN